MHVNVNSAFCTFYKEEKYNANVSIPHTGPGRTG